MSSLTFSKARDIELAWVDGSINMVVDKTDTSAAQEAATAQDSANKDKKADDDGENKLHCLERRGGGETSLQFRQME